MRAAQNALKHGLRAQKYVVLPEEDAGEFAGLEAALIEELAPTGALQTVLARRVAVAAWRLARADRIEADLFEERRLAEGGLGLALIRDGNGTRSFETLLRYRAAAMAEFWRALKTLKALQAEPSATGLDVATPAPARAPSHRPVAHPEIADRAEPSEPERRPGSPPERRPQYVLPDPPEAGRTLHEHAAPWTPNEPERAHAVLPAAALPQPRHEPAAGGAIADVLTPSAAVGGGARRTARAEGSPLSGHAGREPARRP